MHALKWPSNSARIVPVGVGFVDDPDPHLRGDLGARVDDEDLAVRHPDRLVRGSIRPAISEACVEARVIDHVGVGALGNAMPQRPSKQPDRSDELAF